MVGEGGLRDTITVYVVYANLPHGNYLPELRLGSDVSLGVIDVTTGPVRHTAV